MFNVNFVVDGEVYVVVKTGGEETIEIPDDPTKEGYTFGGWYLDDGKWEEKFTKDLKSQLKTHNSNLETENLDL